MPAEPRSTKLRYWMTQAVLCLLLASVVAVAALVKRRGLHLLQVRLDAPRMVGTGSDRYTVQTPAGWAASSVAGGIRLEEGAERGQFPRQLMIIRQRRRDMVTPLEYMAESGILRTGEGERPDVAPATVGRWPGLLARITQRIRPMEGGDVRLRRTLSATAVLPTRDVVSVQLGGDGPADASDEDLVRRVAESIALVNPMPPAPAAGEFTLAGGTKVTLPDRFVTAPSDDPYRVGLRVVGGESPGWVSVEVVPCVLMGGQGAEALATMLACRDPLRPAAPVVGLDENTFVCRGTSAGGLAQSATYLMRGRDGQGVLVELRGDLLPMRQLDALWGAIAASLRFDPAGNAAEARQRGAEVVAQIMTDPQALLAELPASQRWQWYHEDEPSSEWRWSEDEVRAGDEWIEGSRQSLLHRPDGRTARVAAQWRLARDLTHYSYEAQRDGAVVMRRGLSRPTTQPTSGPASQPSDMAMPPGFVPGALLPAVLAKCPDEKLILQTDSILIAEGASAAELLTLVVEPSSDLPRQQDHGERPMRCLSVTISGTGELSRWYFDEDGVLQYIDLTGGLHVKSE